jgi:hypothetical protein
MKAELAVPSATREKVAVWSGQSQLQQPGEVWRSSIVAEPPGRLSTMSRSASRRRRSCCVAVLLAFTGALCQGGMVAAGYMTGLVDRLAAVSAVVAAVFILAALAVLAQKKRTPVTVALLLHHEHLRLQRTSRATKYKKYKTVWSPFATHSGVRAKFVGKQDRLGGWAGQGGWCLVVRCVTDPVLGTARLLAASLCLFAYFTLWSAELCHCRHDPAAGCS